MKFGDLREADYTRVPCPVGLLIGMTVSLLPFLSLSLCVGGVAAGTVQGTVWWSNN